MRAAQQVCWDDIAEAIEPSLPKVDGRNWYAPASTASMICAYFLRRWLDLTAREATLLCASALNTARIDPRQADQFDFVFEHYQLRDIALPLVERQLCGAQAAV